MTEDRLVVAPRRSTQRWVLHRPVSDGYLSTLTVEIGDDGLAATGTATVEGDEGPALPGFLNELAARWRGWTGVRAWESLEGDLRLEARHQGRGYVLLAVTLRRDSAEPDGWLARVVLPIEAGEQLTAIAAEVEEFLL